MPSMPEKCCVCGHEHFKPCYQLDDYSIVRCEKCDTKLNETFFTDVEFRRNLFESEYYESVQSQAFKNRLENYQRDPSVKVYDHYLELLETRFGMKPGKVLDVGSAFGNFLKVADDRGWHPSGVEFSKFSSDLARNQWGFQIFNGDISESPYQEGQFDLVTYWDVIEHVAEPKTNLLRARQLLNDSGRLLVTTDNYDSLLSSIANALYKSTFSSFTYPIRKFYIPHNTYYFTPSNFGMLLKNTGFGVVHSEKLDYPIDKLDVSGVEKILVRSLYALGEAVNKNTGFMIIAEKA